VRGVCRWLLEHGAVVTLGDSPAFGTGLGVARRVGILEAVADLGVKFVELGRPRAFRLSFGARIYVSGVALEHDCIVSLPKLKAHCQTRVTAAMKNLFGCVPGLGKPWAHWRFGELGDRFEAMLLELRDILPQGPSLVDGVVAMHRTGPTGGDPYALGLLAASQSPVALDAAVFSALGLDSSQVPLWAEARRRALPGAESAGLVFPLLQPGDLPAPGFLAPETLTPVTFHPVRLGQSFARRLWARARTR